MRRGLRRERERVLRRPKRFGLRRRRLYPIGRRPNTSVRRFSPVTETSSSLPSPSPASSSSAGVSSGGDFLGGLAALGRRDDQLGFLVRYRRHERSERRERVPVAEILRRALVLPQRREHRGRSLRPYVRILLRRRHRAHQLGDSVEVLPVHDAAERLARVRAREPHQPQRQHPRRLIPGLLARRVLRGARASATFRISAGSSESFAAFVFFVSPSRSFGGFALARKLSTVIGVLAGSITRRIRARCDGDRARRSPVNRLGRDAPTRMRRRGGAGVRVPLRLFLL